MQSIAAQRPAAPAAPMPLKRWSVGALAGLIALATLWFVLCWQLSGEWSLNEQYNYGWFVPFFALYLFWLRWEDRPPMEIPNPKSQIRNHRVAAIIAALIGFAALLLLLPVRLFEIGNPDWRPLSWVHASIVATLTLLYVWHRGGTLWLRHFAFPILFIFVAVPWVTPIEVPVVQGLMQIVAAIASEIAALFGIPAHLEGNLIRIPNGLVGVNEACSGVRSLQTSLMIGLLFGELKRLSIFAGWHLPKSHPKHGIARTSDISRQWRAGPCVGQRMLLVSMKSKSRKPCVPTFVMTTGTKPSGIHFFQSQKVSKRPRRLRPRNALCSFFVGNPEAPAWFAHARTGPISVCQTWDGIRFPTAVSLSMP